MKGPQRLVTFARNVERNFHFRNFRIFHRWSIGGPPVGKPPRKLISPHRWPLVVHWWSTDGFPWVVSTGKHHNNVGGFLLHVYCHEGLGGKNTTSH